MFEKNKKRKGFTIVELVIVIAVIGILSAVLIPTFAGLVQKSKDSALQQNLTNAYTNYVASVDAKTNEIYSKEDVYFVATSAGNKFYDSNELIELGENAVVYQYNSSEGVFEEVELDMNVGYTYKCIITNSNGYTILISE